MIDLFKFHRMFISAVCDPNAVGAGLCNPLEHLKVGDVPGLFARVLNDTGAIIALLAITMLVYAGFRMVTANGEKAAIDKAKGIILYSIYGFISSILAYAAVVAIENFIGVQDPNYDSLAPQNPLSQFKDLKVFTETIVRNLLLIIGLVSMFMIILNGYRYMTARGNETQVDDAKRALTWAIAGLALSLFAYTIVSALANLIYTK